jgi:hypothetical protein
VLRSASTRGHNPVHGIAAGGRVNGAGGTPGGIGSFFLGLAMAAGGGYLLTNQVTVSSGFWNYFGPNTFGLSLLPLLIGVGMLFFDGSSAIGWVLTVAGSAIIFVGILMNLRIYFEPTSLYNTLVMLILLVGGLGLIARSVRPYSK